MKKIQLSNLARLLSMTFKAVLVVTVTTIPLALIGRATLGEAVIALVYLVPVAWSANRWGQLPGISAALCAALFFDFLFIPPFYTFAVARLEGRLVLAIFLGVATIVVERIQASLTRARKPCSCMSSMRLFARVAHLLQLPKWQPKTCSSYSRLPL